jgi:hypothetical protein
VSLTKQVSGQLPTANIADSNVTAVKIATGAVDLTKQVSGQLPTANIADSNVTAVKIATGAVSLTNQVSGTLPVTHGGTGATTLTGNFIRQRYKRDHREAMRSILRPK